MYSKTIIIGNVGKDAEMRFTPSGTAVTSFSVAVNVGYGENKATAWYRVSAWGKTAEACNQYVKKGLRVMVEGELTPDKETGGPRVFTKGDGSSAASFELNAREVKFLSSKSDVGEVAQRQDTPF